MMVRIAGFDPVSDMGRLFRRSTGAVSGLPVTDVAEYDGEYAVVAELPGVKKEDVKISVENRTLTLKGERKHYGFPEGTRVLRHETHTQPFVRSFVLPEEVDVNQISAEMKDGILRIRLPKAEQARPREINIR